MRKAKRIKIILVSPDNWYRYLVGNTFTVNRETKEAYWIDIGGDISIIAIEKKDAKVVEWVEPSYTDKQAEWIEKNNLKIGDKVKFIQSFKEWQDDFNYDNVIGYLYHVDNTYIIKSIFKNYIKLEGVSYPVPYFALISAKKK